MPPLSPSRLRTINLIETLKEERAGRGGGDEEGEDAPEEAVEWPEERIRAWFSERDEEKEKKGNGAGRGQTTPLRAFFPLALPPAPPINPHLRSLWFPAAARLDPAPSASSSKQNGPPSCVLVAFACAGSAEDLWSSEGSGSRRARSPLLQWLSANRGKLLSAQLPGRAARRREPFAESARAVAKEVVALVAAEILVPSEEKEGEEGAKEGAEKEGEEGEEGKKGRIFQQVPWFVAGHSMGAWLAFELASAARDAGLHPPRRLLLSAMPPPHTPEHERPWRGPAATLPTPKLVAECRAWGISEAVFSPGVWEDYEGLLRNDFRLFDEYRFERGADPPFECRLTFFYGNKDARVPQEVAGGWRRYCEGGEGVVGGGGEREEEKEEKKEKSGVEGAPLAAVVEKTGNFELVCVRGGRHLWPLDKQHKLRWLWEIAHRMASDLGLPGPEKEGGE